MIKWDLLEWIIASTAFTVVAFFQAVMFPEVYWNPSRIIAMCFYVSMGYLFCKVVQVITRIK